MSWYGTALDEEQREVLSMLDGLGGSLEPLTGGQRELDEQTLAAVVDAGVWALGAPEELGGAGADLSTALLVLERLGRYWPALGWASVQTQTALTLLAGGQAPEVASALVEGTAGVVVVESDATHVSLAESQGAWTGHIDRTDVAADCLAVIVLDGASTGLVFTAGSFSVEPVGTTGLAGALTQRVTLEAAPAVVVEVDLQPARALLRLGAGAVAAGIAGAATDAAVDYTGSRTQFGGPLTDIPVVRQSIAEQAFATSRAITGVMSADVTSLTSVTAALVDAAEAAVEVAGKSIQSHGGYGYLDEYPTVRLLRDAVSLRSAVDTFGAARKAGRSLVGLPGEAQKEKSREPVGH